MLKQVSPETREAMFKLLRAASQIATVTGENAETVLERVLPDRAGPPAPAAKLMVVKAQAVA